MLRDRVVAKQRELGLRDGEMAARLDIPRTTYNMFKTRSRRPSLFMVAKIVAAFPDLAPHILDDVLTEGESKVAAS